MNIGSVPLQAGIQANAARLSIDSMNAVKLSGICCISFVARFIASDYITKIIRLAGVVQC